MLNQIIGKRYKILSRLGKGLLGETFLCLDNAAQKEVTMKVISSPLIKKQSVFNNFYETFRKMLYIEHDNILKALDSGLTAYEEEESETGSELIPFIIFEYYNANPLIPGLRTFNVIESLEIFKKLLYTIDKFHQKDLVHRAIKPGNILIDNNNFIKISHFGLYPLTDYQSSNTYSDIVSTIYRAPEITQGQIGDITSDYYSIGAVLYQLLTGNYPFSGKNADEILQAQLLNKIPSPAGINTNVNPKLENLILRLLESNIENRYFSIDEINNDIDILFAPVKQGSKHTMGKLHFPAEKKQSNLIGRSNIEKNIKKEIAAKKNDQPLIVCGPSGYGKTTAIQSALSASRKKDVEIITHRCAPTIERPFASVITLCSFILDKHEKAGTFIPAPSWIISVLLGKRDIRMNDGETLSTIEQKKIELTVELTNFLNNIITETTILLIENFQWSDEFSLDFLRNYLNQKNSFLKIIADFDSDYSDDYFPPSSKYKIYTLSPLTQVEIEKALKKQTGALGINKNFLKSMEEKSCGNIMYISSALNYLNKTGKLTFEKKILSADDYDLKALPDTLEDLIDKIFRSLPERIKSIYKTASCMGLYFDTKTVFYILENLPESTIQEVLKESENLGIHSSDPKSGQLYFTNPIYHQFFYNENTDLEKNYIHGKIADSLEKETIDLVNFNADLLHYHFELAGEEEKTLEYLIEIAEKSIVLQLPERASAIYLDLISRLEGRENSAKKLWHAYHNLALIYFHQKENKKARHYFFKAADLADLRNDLHAHQECMYYLSEIYLRENNIEAAEKTIAKALRKDLLKDTVWKSRLLVQKAITAKKGDYTNIYFEEALGELNKALQIARELRNMKDSLKIMETMALLYTEQHMDSIAEIILYKIFFFRISLTKKIEILEKLTRLFIFPGNDMNKVKNYADMGTALASQYSEADSLAIFTMLKALACNNIGETESAVELIESAYIAKDDNDFKLAVNLVHADILYKQGDLEKSDQILLQNEEFLSKVTNLSLISGHWYQKGLNRLNEEPAAALEFFQKAEETASTGKNTNIRLQAIAGCAEAQRGLKNYEKAERFLLQGSMLKKYRHNDYIDALFIMTQALIHRNKHNNKLALELLDICVSKFHSSGNIYEEGRALLEKANILTQIKMDATAEISKAEAAFKKFGNKNELLKLETINKPE